MYAQNDFGQLGHMVLGKPTLAISGAAAATFNIGAALPYTSNGIVKSKGTGAGTVAAPTTSTTRSNGVALTAVEAQQWALYQIPANKTAYLVVALDGGGNWVTFQGGYDGQDPSFRGLGGRPGKSVIPGIPHGFTPVGVIKVACGSAAFTPATTALDAANITFTFTDYAVLPVGAAP